MKFFADLVESRGYIRGLIEASVSDEISDENMATYVDAVHAAAHRDSLDGRPSADAYRAAVGSLIVDESLTPRDGLLASILTRLEALENEVL